MEIEKISTLMEFLAMAERRKACEEKLRALKEKMDSIDVETDEGAEAWNTANEEALNLDIEAHRAAIALDMFCLESRAEDAGSRSEPVAEA